MMRALAILLAAVALSACERAEEPIPAHAVMALSDAFTGEFALIGKNGETVTDEDFEGKVMLVYFGFTQCPDVCPGDIGVIGAALNELGDQAGEIAPVFISVDPERDTPEALRDYFAFDERIIPLTGSDEAAAMARQGFKVIAQKQPLPDSALEYTINHQRFYFIANRAGQPEYAVKGEATPRELAAVLRRSIREP